MKYKNNIKALIVGMVLTIAFSSCDDWLDVKPIDQLLEEQVYESELTIQAALNGIYLKMANTSLYGQDLTNRTVETIAQQYMVPEGAEKADPTKYYTSRYAYSDETVKATVYYIWTDAYNTILDINYFIKKLNQTPNNVIIQSKKEILLGEAYALRAFIHLDILRLFGPIYSENPNAISIPYYTDPTVDPMERESADAILDKIVSDLNISLELLKNDPVISYGVMVESGNSNVGDFYQYRNRRMNYYAASALKVRALMYQNSKKEAAELALYLIQSSGMSSHFPWITKARVEDTEKQDRIFSTEVLFGIHSSNMYKIWSDRFSPEISDPSKMYGYRTDNIKELFDASGSDINLKDDFRAKHWRPYQEPSYQCSYKFSRTAKEAPFWYFQPLIRKTEIYYILAECKNDMSYINTVRQYRGPLPASSATLDAELEGEYRREFLGEGQLFYYYKRRNFPKIKDGSSNGTIDMDKDKYVIPIPEGELER